MENDSELERREMKKGEKKNMKMREKEKEEGDIGDFLVNTNTDRKTIERKTID